MLASALLQIPEPSVGFRRRGADPPLRCWHDRRVPPAAGHLRRPVAFSVPLWRVGHRNQPRCPRRGFPWSWVRSSRRWLCDRRNGSPTWPRRPAKRIPQPTCPAKSVPQTSCATSQDLRPVDGHTFILAAPRDPAHLVRKWRRLAQRPAAPQAYPKAARPGLAGPIDPAA